MQVHLKIALPTLCFAFAPAATAQISFTQAPSIPTGQRADGQTFADLDGDGLMDLARATDGAANQDLVELYRGAGDGSFTPAGLIFMPNSSSPSAVVAADVDGDGDMDLAITLQDFNQVVIARNNGGFGFSSLPGVGTGGIETRTIDAGDMDGDGDPDFVVASRDSNNVSVLLNQAGTLTLAGTFPAGQEPRDVVIGDWNGDGLGDVAAAAHDSRQVVTFTGTGGGQLGAAQFLSVPAGARPSGIATGDMDGDGDLDLVAGNGDDDFVFQNFVSVYTNTGGSFGAPTNFAAGGFDAGDVLTGDFDLDGVLDVAVALESNASVATLRGLGGGALAAPALFATGAQPSTLVGADLDGNGSLDLGLTLRQAPNVHIFLNDASGPGTPWANYCTALANSSGAAATMSASGSGSVAANDLVVVSSSMPQNTVGYFLPSRTQRFVPMPAGSSGNLCLGGAIGRYSNSVLASGVAGEISLSINLAQMPTPTGFVTAVAGETWNFQSWFRDALLGSPTSNFSDGLAVSLQ